MRSSEGAKVVVEAKQRAVMLEVQVEQLRRRVDRTEKKARGAKD
jgi:predicted ATP-grasp superfamily ATP-dependent carboligase